MLCYPQHLSGFRIDKVHLRAGQALDQFHTSYRHRLLPQRTSPVQFGRLRDSDKEKSSPLNESSTYKEAPPVDLGTPKLREVTASSQSFYSGSAVVNNGAVRSR